MARHVVGVQEALELLLHRRVDLRVDVARAHADHAHGEVDKDVAVDVADQRPAAVGEDELREGRHGREAGRGVAALAGPELTGARAWQLSAYDRHIGGAELIQGAWGSRGGHH